MSLSWQTEHMVCLPCPRLGLLLGVASLTWPTSTRAWTERGHDVITRVAIHRVSHHMGDDRRLARPLVFRQDMLGHISNIPDTGWREGDPEVVRLNGPTHYTALNELSARPTFQSVPLDIRTAYEAACRNGHDLATHTGTAIWRTAQLAELLERHFAAVKKGQTQKPKVPPDQIDALILESMVTAGLLSHFVGDLSNPDHTHSQFDGWHCNQGGIHDYFETSVVDALGLDLPERVWDHMERHSPLTALLSPLSSADRARARQSPAALALLLALDAYHQRNEMFQVDRKHAVIQPSQLLPRKTKADRRPAHRVATHFESLLVTRFAVAANLLAYLWIRAWERGGKPDMSGYGDWAYAMSPPFVPMSYLDGLPPTEKRQCPKRP